MFSRRIASQAGQGPAERKINRKSLDLNPNPDKLAAQEDIVMWQVLGFAGFVIATLGVAYGFWMISSLYKELPDIPANQLNYAFFTNINKFKGRIAIFLQLSLSMLPSSWPHLLCNPNNRNDRRSFDFVELLAQRQ